LLGHGFLLDSIQHPSDKGRECFSHRAKLNDSVMACNIFSSGELRHNIFVECFEPSISMKSNRGSIWVKTIIISTCHDFMHTFQNTYPLAVGYDAVNHDTVESLFASDLQDFREGKLVSFYHGGLKQSSFIWIFWHLFKTNQRDALPIVSCLAVAHTQLVGDLQWILVQLLLVCYHVLVVYLH
jgi:hypothetical protein